MSKPSTIRGYGKQSKKPKHNRLFAELPQTPVRKRQPAPTKEHDALATENQDFEKLARDLSTVQIEERDDLATPEPVKSTPQDDGRRKRYQTRKSETAQQILLGTPKLETPKPQETSIQEEEAEAKTPEPVAVWDDAEAGDEGELQVLSWAELCPPGDRIVKIAEASYAEVYRVTNERGTSIIKVIRMESPIRGQTKAQQKSGLVDEEPHSEEDLIGELQISEWLADIPGFVVYKERYIVEGRACRELLDTHQAFHRRLKRQDPDRLQFYPSPSRYLDDTRFLVVELGDAGTALEDFQLSRTDQVWDIFFHVAIALARAEAQLEFEHRDLHEGNVCIRRVADPTPESERTSSSSSAAFGHSGLDITILDYGLSRACPPLSDEADQPMAYDLERDLSLFTSDHAPQCAVYRQMRSFWLSGGERGVCLPPEEHRTAYARCPPLSLAEDDGEEEEEVVQQARRLRRQKLEDQEKEEQQEEPLSWSRHEPYTNVLWLAYLYRFMTGGISGGGASIARGIPRRQLTAFKKETAEFWRYLDPSATSDDGVDAPGFESASDVVRFAVEVGWVAEEQLMGGVSGAGGNAEDADRSIFSILSGGRGGDGEDRSALLVRRSPRRQPSRRAAL